MAFWTYILECSDGSYYMGHTDDLEKRTAQHQDGTFPGYTHTRRPVKLVWAHDFQTRSEALSNELRIKPWARSKKQAPIASDGTSLSYLAIPPDERKEGASASPGPVPRLRSGRTGVGDGEAGPVIVLVRPQLGENIGKAA